MAGREPISRRRSARSRAESLAAPEILAEEHLRAMDADPDIDRQMALFQIIRASMVISNDLEREVHRPRGWTFAGFNIMSAIAMLDAPEPSQVARLSGTTRPTVSSVVKTLEQDGLVVRTREERDRRVVRLSLTEAGQQAYIHGLRAVAQREAEWLGGLTAAEVRQLLTLLRKATNTLPPRSQPTPSAAGS